MAYSKPTRITAQIVEKNIQAHRAIEVQKREFGAFSAENAKLVYVANAQQKVEAKRRETYQNACIAEQQYENRTREEHYQRRIQSFVHSQNEALANQMDKETADEERRAREIQRLCEEAPELRDLERALKIAYMNKDRAAQHQEKILLATQEANRIQAMEDEMEFGRQKAIEADAEKLAARKELYMRQREVLQGQILERQELLREAQRQAEEDKRNVDEIVRRINEEDEADMKAKRERQEATAKLVKQYERQRLEELARRKAAEKAEEERILKYNMDMAARNEGVAAKKLAKKDEEDRILQRIVEEAAKKRAAEEEFNTLRDMLWEEELEAKKRADEENRIRKAREMKKDMMDANSRMMLAKAESRRKEAEEEARMVQLMKKKFAEDEARERLEEEKLRNIKLHHMTLIEEQRRDRKNMYDLQKEKEAQEVQLAIEREEYRRKVIQEARKRLLEEHAAKLKGYMPDGVFMNKEEYEVFQDFSGDSNTRK
jgi:hypothetical protein